MTDLYCYQDIEFSSLEDIRRLQEIRLGQHLAYCSKFSPYYKKALKKDGTNLEAANNLASLYIETGVDYETGLQLMIRATNNLEEIPPYALDTLGVLYLNLGSKVEAEKFLIEACGGVIDDDALKEEIRSHLLELGINKRCEQ